MNPVILGKKERKDSAYPNDKSYEEYKIRWTRI